MMSIINSVVILLLIGSGDIIREAISSAGAIDLVQYHDPHFKPNRSVIVHLFEWKFSDVANECENFLGPKGFAGVQLSPVNENLIVRWDNIVRPWWERYQPMSYKIQTRSGDEEGFLNMSRRCNMAGVRIYVDVVLNHMAAPAGEMIGTAGSTANGTSLYYEGVPYTSDDFHSPCTIENYRDAYEIRNCQLGTLPDLDQSSDKVRSRIIDFLNHLVSMGVAGFRVDAAKHMWPNDLEEIYSAVDNLSVTFDFPENSRPFFYQEVIDLGGEAISKTEYDSLGPVTEFLHSAEIGIVFRRKAPLSTLVNWGPTMGFLSHQDALIFVDNHDNQRGNGAGGDFILTFRSPKPYQMAIGFMLAHPYGIPRIMSSFNFNSTDEGPPMVDAENGDENIQSPEFDENELCIEGGGWICEHRWNAIWNMVEFRNVVDGETIINWQDNGPNQIAFCRGSRGFIAFNNAPGEDFIANVSVCLEPGKYCDVVSGYRLSDSECSGRVISVNENRTAEIFIPYDVDNGFVAIHEFSRIASKK